VWISPGRSKLIERYRALIGELGWHSVTFDGTIESMSQSHYDSVLEAVRAFRSGRGFERLRILEVGCYAHTTGYKLMRELDADVTLFDISAKALALGRRLAGDHVSGRVPRLVAGDFHRLPFEA